MKKKSIFPKCEHLRIIMYANVVFGVWPFLFEDYPTLKKIYDFYNKFILFYYILYIISGYIKLFQILFETPLPVSEIMLNISITFIYSVTITRAYRMRNPRMMKIIKNIMDWEKKIVDSGDEKLISIINEYALQNKIVTQIFSVAVVVVTAFFVIHPLSIEPVIKFNPVTNVTRIVKPLPLSSWFPFDEQEYYHVAYAMHILDCYIGASFVNNTDIFSFGLITFPLGQIVILNQVLIHFDEYVSKVQKQLGIEKEEASFVTIRECILKHKDIISYIAAYNEEMSMIALMDFLQSSLQLAAIVLEVIFFDFNIVSFLFSLLFVLCMLNRLFGYYWYANEIMIESTNIPMSIWSCDWHNAPRKTQQMMLMMMLRCSRPLTMDIGPFNTMSINTLMGIIKATYSYSMLIYRGKQK